LAFGGKPQLVVDHLLAGDFASVTGENILKEAWPKLKRWGGA
jgi:hypothetical protein